MPLLCLALALPLAISPSVERATDLTALLPNDTVLVVEAASLAELHTALRASNYGALVFGPDGLLVRAAASFDGLPDGADAAAVARLFLAPAPTPELRAKAGNTWSALYDAVRATSGPLQMHLAADFGAEDFAFTFTIAMQTPGLARQNVEQWLAIAGERSGWLERLGFEVAIEPGSSKLDENDYFLGCREDLVVFVAGSDHGQARREFSRIARGVTSGALGPVANPNLVAARAALDPRDQVRVLVDLAPIGTRLASAMEDLGSFDRMPPESRAQLAAMHLADMRFAAFGLHLGAGEAFFAEGALAMPSTGFVADMMKTMHARPPAALLGRVPKTAKAVSSGGMDPVVAAALVRKLLVETSPEMVAEMDQKIAEVVTQSGVDILAVLVEEFTGQYVSYVRSQPAASLEDMGMLNSASSAVIRSMGLSSTSFVEVRDAARVESALDAMLVWGEGALGGPLPIDEFTIDGQRVRGLQQENTGLWFGFASGVMVLGFDADAVAADLARAQAETPALGERLTQVLTAHAGAGAVTVWSTRDLVVSIGNLFGAVDQLVGGNSSASDPADGGAATGWLASAAASFEGTIESGFEFQPGILHVFMQGR